MAANKKQDTCLYILTYMHDNHSKGMKMEILASTHLLMYGQYVKFFPTKKSQIRPDFTPWTFKPLASFQRLTMRAEFGY